MFFLKSILGVMLVGSLGAVLSKQINLGNLPWWMGIVSSGLVGLVWGWMASQKESIITYVAVLHFLGESISLAQFWGSFLAVVGIILVNQ